MTTLATRTTPRHLLRIGDLTRTQLEHLLDLAARMKAAPLGFHTLVSGWPPPATSSSVGDEGMSGVPAGDGC